MKREKIRTTTNQSMQTPHRLLRTFLTVDFES